MVETPTPQTGQVTALAALADSARRYLSRWHRRRPLWVGVAIGGVVDGAHRDRRPPSAGMDGRAGRAGAGRDAGPAGVGGRARRRDGRSGAAAGHAAVRPARAAVDQPVHLRPRDRRLRAGDRRAGAQPRHRPGQHRGAARPLGAAWAGRVGWSPRSATRRCWPPRDDSASPGQPGRRRRCCGPRGPAASPRSELLAERARVLGSAVALLRDMLNPDELVVGGQAFTEYPEGMARGRGRLRRRARRCRRATSGSPRSATGCRRPAPGWCRWVGCTPTRSARCGARPPGGSLGLTPRCRARQSRRVPREYVDTGFG